MGATVYEVVTGQIRLSMVPRFQALHRDELLPLFEKYDVRPLLFLLSEVGDVNRFLDIYVYDSYEDYDEKTSRLLRDEAIPAYYEKVEQCIIGSISVSLMRSMSYSPEASFRPDDR